MIRVIYVDKRAQSIIFIDGDQEVLNAFAVQAGIAIENARLYEAVQLTNQSKSKFISVVTL